MPLQNLDKIYSFGRDSYEEDYEVESQLLVVYTELSDEAIGKHLQIMYNEQVIVIKIFGNINDVLVVVQTYYLSINVVTWITAFDL